MPKILLLLFMSISLMCFAQDSIINREFRGKISGGLTYHPSNDFNSVGGQFNVGCSWLTKKGKIRHKVYVNVTNFKSDVAPEDKRLLTMNFYYSLSPFIIQIQSRKPQSQKISYEPSFGICRGIHSRVVSGIGYAGGSGQYIESYSEGLHWGIIYNPISFSIKQVNRMNWYIETPMQVFVGSNLGLILSFSLTIGTNFG